MVAHLVDWVEANLPPQASLLVLPEGVSVNYLTRRVNPTRHLNFLPPEIMIFDEDRILEDLRAQPPDYVVLVHRETPEYGLPLFGTDYALSVTGIAGPEGGTDDKLVGTTYIGLASAHSTIATLFRFGTDRHINRTRAVNAALEMLRREILDISN